MLDSSRSSWDDEGSTPEVEPVTLCIAAECEYRGSPALALCADWRGQTGDINQPDTLIGSDDTNKTRDFRKATVMLAGKDTKAVELASACKAVIREFTELQFSHEDLDLAVDGFMQKLRQVAANKKMEMIQTFVQNSVGLPHSEFVKLPTDQYIETWHSIRQMNLGADLLIAFVSHEAIIITLDRWGEPHWAHNYAVIGNGAEIARAMLCLQTWTPAQYHDSSFYTRTSVPLEECLFRVDEAHFAAHKANPASVGEFTTFLVLAKEYRASVRQTFRDKIAQMVRVKHRVPTIPLARSQSELLGSYQSLTTGKIQPEEPDGV